MTLHCRSNCLLSFKTKCELSSELYNRTIFYSISLFYSSAICLVFLSVLTCPPLFTGQTNERSVRNDVTATGPITMLRFASSIHIHSASRALWSRGAFSRENSVFPGKKKQSTVELLHRTDVRRWRWVCLCILFMNSYINRLNVF